MILATRTYKNVLVQPIRNGKGASAADPQHFLAEGDEKIELIRTLAKVKVHIPNSATAEPDGTGKYKIKQFLPSRINKITLKNELPYQSLFLNPFLDSRVFPYLGTGGILQLRMLRAIMYSMIVALLLMLTKLDYQLVWVLM